MHRTVNKLARLSLTLLPAFALQSAVAQSSSAYQSVDELVEKLMKRTHVLERQVARLNKKLKHTRHTAPRTQTVHHVTSSLSKPVKPHPKKSQYHADAMPNHLPHEAIDEPVKGLAVLSDATLTPRYFHDHIMPVLGSPYLGVRTQFDGHDLIVNTSYINKDLALLQVHQHMLDTLHAHGETMPDHPVIEMSGAVTGALYKQHNYHGTNRTDLDLTGAKFDIFSAVNDWVNAFMQFEYDNSVTTLTRVKNSKVQLNNGFVTFGNLNRTPYYATFGQIYMPFGQFSTHLESTPMVRSLGRVLNRGAVFGFNHRQDRTSINGSVFTFRGDTKVGGSHKAPEYIYEYGANLSGAVHEDHVSYGGGVSYISGIAESMGNQSNAFGVLKYSAYGLSYENENFEHRVPAFDARAFWGYDGFKVYAEVVKSLRSFSASDLSHNDHGARPEAYYLEASYGWNVYGKPASIAATVGKTKEAFALGLPEKRFAVSASYTPLRDTVVSLEYRHDRQYGKSTRGMVQNTALSAATLATRGKEQDLLTAQVDVYF